MSFKAVKSTLPIIRNDNEDRVLSSSRKQRVDWVFVYGPVPACLWSKWFNPLNPVRPGFEDAMSVVWTSGMWWDGDRTGCRPENGISLAMVV